MNFAIPEASIQNVLNILNQPKPACVHCFGLSEGAEAYFVKQLSKISSSPILVVFPTASRLQAFTNDISFFLGKKTEIFPYVFPAYNMSPFKNISFHNEIAAERISLLYNLLTRSPKLIVTTVDALLQRVFPKEILRDYGKLISVNKEIERESLIEKLLAGGYVRTPLVEEAGDFSVRGDIIDIFSPQYTDPIRIEQFGDLIESIRFFSADTQRTLSHEAQVEILPAREAVLHSENLENFVQAVRLRASEQGLSGNAVRSLVERIYQTRATAEIDALYPLLYDRMDTLLDYMPSQTQIVLMNTIELQKKGNLFYETQVENFELAISNQKLCVPPEMLYAPWADCLEKFKTRFVFQLQEIPCFSEKKIETPSYISASFFLQSVENIGIALKVKPHVEDGFSGIVAFLKEQIAANRKVIIPANTDSEKKRLVNLISPEIPFVQTVSNFNQTTLPGIYVCEGQITKGFIWPTEDLAILTQEDIFGRIARRKIGHRKKIEFLKMEDLQMGDLIVHEDHGIGRYDGLVRLVVEGIENDFILLTYQDDDKLYLPIDRMAMIQKYIGIEDISVALDKMGSKSWQQVKEKVKRSAEKIAKELLELYVVRKTRPGYAFSYQSEYFHDFEAGFEYEETPDQLRAIEDVLHDMEKPNPMDRLVCGDVGYGKTEVALRAAFLAAIGGKQVALLVPTTILAQQHYQTFLSRLEPYPLRVACLSRFSTPKQQKKILEEIIAGSIDIVIGTHRLLQKDIAFKDLGLIVIDEEHRFGVRHKEKLKKLRETVDVLALTATPIPRTLHMALSGVRDISVIATAPQDRQRILTYVSEYNEAVIKDAITKEIARGGQVYFLHNNIRNIDRMANKVEHLVPHAKVRVAHGQMKEHQLEKTMVAFQNKEIDVLVSTTIVESGLDIPTANTMIINRADRFGLSQIYQLRGRIGRSSEQAYAYLFIPDETLLTKNAIKRLKVLMEHDGLGAGFQIAMSDLKIRGGGTILGSSQSGHIAAVGYDLFLKLMETAMAEIKEEPIPVEVTPELHIPLTAFFPEDYIMDIDQRLQAYRRLSQISSMKEIAQYREDLEDRFGSLPEQVSNLLFKIMLKVLSQRAGVIRLDLINTHAVFTFSAKGRQDGFEKVVNLVQQNPDQFKLISEYVLKTLLKSTRLNQKLLEIRDILKEFQ